jgi:hypothetical protein
MRSFVKFNKILLLLPLAAIVVAVVYGVTYGWID